MIFLIVIALTVSMLIAGIYWYKNRQDRQDALRVSKILYKKAENNALRKDALFIRKKQGIWIDKKKNLLAYVILDKYAAHHSLIDLSALKLCEIRKNYTDQQQGGILFLRRSQKHIDTIVLRLEQENSSEPAIEIPFYRNNYDRLSEMKMLFQKAWHLKRLIER